MRNIMIVMLIKRWLTTLSEKGPDLLKEHNNILVSGAGLFFFFLISHNSQDEQCWSVIDYNPLYLQKGEKKQEKKKRKEALGCGWDINSGSNPTNYQKKTQYLKRITC